MELRLRDDSSRAPIAGAIVRLLRNDSIIAQTLTNEQGAATLRGDRPGSYRLRIDRIGFTGFLTSSFPLEAGTIFRPEVPVASTPLLLPDVIVRGGKSPCDTRPADRDATAGLWEEIRKALTANILTQEDEAVSLLVRLFEREVDQAGRPLREWVFRSAITRSQPFASLPAGLLAQVGFVYAEQDTAVFAAPDARLLLSDEFVATHCFRAVPGPANRLGLAFEPAPGRTLPDVAGTLWVNRLTGELQELEYEYTGLARELARSELGGRVEFRRLPSGNWIVSYWHVRMPVLESFERRRPRRSIEEFVRVVSLIERGGRAEIATGQPGLEDRAILIGRVMDSTTGSGLGGAVVAVAGTADSAVASSSGEFAFTAAASGPSRVTVRHPKLSVTGAPLEREAVLSLGDTARVDFAVPSLASLARARCGSPGKRSGVVGAVWTGAGTPDPNAELLATWRTPLGSVRTVRGRADPSGGFAFCDLPPDQPVTLHIRRGNAPVGQRTVSLGWAEFQWLELGLAVPR